jgi:hypothetical protein
MFFEFIVCQIMSTNVRRIYGAFEIFFRILKIILAFSEITFNFKNRIITKNKISSNQQYIWLESSHRALSKIQNPILRFDPKLPELLAEVQDSSNSDEQLISICASSVESEGTIVFVSSTASSWCLRFVDPTDGSSAIDEFVLGSGELRLLR